MDDFVIARNPDEDSTLPYLVRLPLTEAGIVLKVRDTWPRTAKVYCHPSTDWPQAPEVVERVPVRSWVRRGAAIDLVLDRGRENRSQFVFTRARGREVIFWQSARTARQARPNVSVPTQRASGQVLEILVDSHERYPWKSTAQQATTRRQGLPAGDYAVELDGTIVAAVERKSLAGLVSTMTTGKRRYLLAALAEVPHAALVVEDRYSVIFKLTHTRPAVDRGRIQGHERRPLIKRWFGRGVRLAGYSATSRIRGLVELACRRDRGARGRAAHRPGRRSGVERVGDVEPSTRGRVAQRRVRARDELRPDHERRREVHGVVPTQ